jgi:16S rRNA (cytosine967-C5)-methyltransferase
MAGVQRAMLVQAATLVAPGGALVYSTCSLEPEEGAAQVEAFLGAHGEDFERVAITAPEIGGEADWITPAGDLRTLPFHMDLEMGLEPDALAGMDGFYVARLRRRA